MITIRELKRVRSSFIVNCRKAALDLLRSPYTFAGTCAISFVEYCSQVKVAPLLSNRFGLNSLSVVFSCSYIMGMVSRYFPTVWQALGTGAGSSIFPLAHRLAGVVELFPALVVDHLTSTVPHEV